jgi:cytochrome b561
MMKSLLNTGAYYGPISKFLHWVIAVLALLMLALSYFIGDIPNKIMQGIAFNFHKLIGLSILALMVLRLIWTLINPKPALPLNTKAWERWAERTVHYLLYFALVLMPLVGWIGAVAGGHPPRWGETKLNLPIPQSEWLDDLAFNIHNKLAIVIIALVSIHIVAALYHRFIIKDNIFQRMWP